MAAVSVKRSINETLLNIGNRSLSYKEIEPKNATIFLWTGALGKKGIFEIQYLTEIFLQQCKAYFRGICNPHVI